MRIGVEHAVLQDLREEALEQAVGQLLARHRARVERVLIRDRHPGDLFEHEQPAGAQVEVHRRDVDAHVVAAVAADALAGLTLAA